MRLSTAQTEVVKQEVGSAFVVKVGMLMFVCASHK